MAIIDPRRPSPAGYVAANGRHRQRSADRGPCDAADHRALRQTRLSDRLALALSTTFAERSERTRKGADSQLYKAAADAGSRCPERKTAGKSYVPYPVDGDRPLIGKKCISKTMKSLDYGFAYPDFKAGYGEIVKSYVDEG